MSFKALKQNIKDSLLLIAVIFAVIVFRSSFYEPFRIPSGSMIPTLMIGDFILVNKFAYGLKVPFSDLTIGESINLNPIYIFGKSNPKRGDVVVFKFPNNPNANYIKRVIGLPGDTLEMKNKVVYVNGRAITSEVISGKEIMDDMDDKFKGYNYKFLKTKTGDHEHIVQIDQDNYYKLDFQKTTIPPGKFFMMGDNRDNSYDSRGWGFVSHELIKGRAELIWFSMNLPIGDSHFKFRPWRIFKKIN